MSQNNYPTLLLTGDFLQKTNPWAVAVIFTYFGRCRDKRFSFLLFIRYPILSVSLRLLDVHSLESDVFISICCEIEN